MKELKIKKIRITSDEYKKAIVPRSRSTRRLQDNDSIQSAYKQALATLRHLQSTGGTLLFGRDLFKFQVQVLGAIKGDHTNVQKGCEDALNRIAWDDDKQNRFLEDGPFWSCMPHDRH